VRANLLTGLPAFRHGVYSVQLQAEAHLDLKLRTEVALLASEGARFAARFIRLLFLVLASPRRVSGQAGPPRPPPRLDHPPDPYVPTTSQNREGPGIGGQNGEGSE
jgi:hypothetical protein